MSNETQTKFNQAVVIVINALSAKNKGLVTIADIRAQFAHFGLARAAFDALMLEAERMYIVDLKTGNDPKRIANLADAIQDGRRNLMYAFVR